MDKTIKILNDKGYKITLKRDVDENTIMNVMEAQKTLSKIVIPLVTHYHVCLFDKEFNEPLPDNSDSRKNYLFIRNQEEINPTPIKELFDNQSPVEILFSESGLPSNDWLRVLKNSYVDKSKYYSISFAKLFEGGIFIKNENRIETIKLIDRNLRSSHVPVKKIKDSYWVSGHANELMIYPPIFYEVNAIHGHVYFSIWITWDGVWDILGCNENQFYENEINELVKKGWILN